MWLNFGNVQSTSDVWGRHKWVLRLCNRPGAWRGMTAKNHRVSLHEIIAVFFLFLLGYSRVCCSWFLCSTSIGWRFRRNKSGKRWKPSSRAVLQKRRLFDSVKTHQRWEWQLYVRFRDFDQLVMSTRELDLESNILRITILCVCIYIYFFCSRSPDLLTSKANRTSRNWRNSSSTVIRKYANLANKLVHTHTPWFLYVLPIQSFCHRQHLHCWDVINCAYSW